MSKWTLRFAVIAASVTGALLLSSCAHEPSTPIMPVEKNYYHCVYKNVRTHATFSANGGTMKHARRAARHECRTAGHHHKACHLSFCKYVH